MSPQPDLIARSIVDRLFPIVSAAVVGPEAGVVKARIRAAVDDVLRETSAEAASAQRAMQADFDIAMTAELADRRAEMDRTKTDMKAECRALREADATSAALALQNAVAAVRQEEQAAAAEAQRQAIIVWDACCTKLRAEDATAAQKAQTDAVAAARADEQSKCSAARAADAKAAETKRLADVAAARLDERAKCVAEIAVAPVTGITVALTLFAASMRSQIQSYVKAGPYK